MEALVTGGATCATSTAGEGEGGAIGLADCANGFGAADRSAAGGVDCMNGFACMGGGFTDAVAGFACTGGGATGASNAGRDTGRTCTGGVHGASGAADCGNGGGRFDAGLRIGFGGGDDGIAEAGRWIGAAGAADTGPAFADGATLAPSSGGRLRFGGGGGWLTFGRACAVAAGAWLGTGRWGGGGAAD